MGEHTTVSPSALPASTTGPQNPVSLRRMALWLPILGVVLLAGATLMLTMVSLSVLQVADSGGENSALQQMERLRSVGNLERLIALGDQLDSESDPAKWRATALTMQALVSHPSLTALASGNADVAGTYDALSQMQSLQEAASQASRDTTQRQALQDEAHALWQQRRLALKALADDTAVDIVQHNTQAAEAISASARKILITTMAGAALGLAACVALLLSMRRYFLTPLLKISDFLNGVNRHQPVESVLPEPNSQEMAEVVEAVQALTQAQTALEDMALHDRLTGLFNRYALEARLNQALSHARRDGRRSALMFIDLDRFKSVNDTLGHAAGDELLQTVAQRLGTSIRETDTLARQGGDEFILAVDDVKDINAVGMLAQKMLDLIAQPIRLGGLDLNVSASIGISLFPDDGAELSELMKNADIAMYQAKAAGRGAFRFFNASMNSAALARLHLENDLQHALERREFVLHYQPQVRYTNGAILGMEALIRWQRPDGQLVSPLDFIPIAEDNGLIIPIGEWVLREACHSLAQWRKLGHTSLRMAINISARQFRSAGLVEAIRRALADFALPAHCLELEITESVAMENPQETIRTLRAIKDMGVSLSIDDFGTGYSSLAYLKLFPIDYLKLDRAFVKDIEVDPNDAVICAAAVSLAHSMKLKVVAEGVESAAQAVYLNDQGVDLMQGFLFSRPVQRDSVPALLTARLRETHPVP